MNSFQELYSETCKQGKTIYELCRNEEAAFAQLSAAEFRKIVKTSLDAMKQAVKTGLGSNELSNSGMCGNDCAKLQTRLKTRPTLFGGLYEKIISYALATSEENARMGRIAACPTAGSCGIVPSVLIAVSEELHINEDEQINALITAGEIGRIISQKVALAGAVGGCQAECGVASAMSAGALAQLLGGNPSQIINAVALAMKNLLGLTCDPVCGLVEVPCVKRNPFLAIHAVTAAELALSGIVSQIPADEVVDALKQTANLMSPLLKESAQAGLAKTKTAIKISQKNY